MKSLLQVAVITVLISASIIAHANEEILADEVMPESDINLRVNRPFSPGPSMKRCEVWVSMQLPANQEPNVENILVLERKDDPQKERIAKVEFLKAIQTDDYADPRLRLLLWIKGDEQTGYETFRREARYHEGCS